MNKTKIQTPSKRYGFLPRRSTRRTYNKMEEENRNVTNNDENERNQGNINQNNQNKRNYLKSSSTLRKNQQKNNENKQNNKQNNTPKQSQNEELNQNKRNTPQSKRKYQTFKKYTNNDDITSPDDIDITINDDNVINSREIIPTISNLADECFTKSDEEIEAILRKRIKIQNRWDLKERVRKRDEIIKHLKELIKRLKDDRSRFRSQCVDTELGLLHELKATEDKIILFQNAYNRMKDELKVLKKEKNDIKLSLEKAKTEIDNSNKKMENLDLIVQPLNEKLENVKNECNDYKEKYILYENKYENILNEYEVYKTEKNNEEELLKNKIESLENNWNNKFLNKVQLLEEQHNNLNEKIQQKEEEIINLLKEKEIHMEKIHELENTIDLIREEKNNLEKIKGKLEVEVEHLREELKNTKANVENSSSELHLALASMAEVQKAGLDRENLLREAKKEIEERLNEAEKEGRKLLEELSEYKMKDKLQESELKNIHENYNEMKTSYNNMQVESRNNSELLAVEKEMRKNAEMRAEQEREEVTALYAQLHAIKSELKKLNDEKEELIMENDEKIELIEGERDELNNKIKDHENTIMQLEQEVRSLTESLKDARSNTEEIERLSKISGEAEVLRKKVMELESLHTNDQKYSNQRIKELEEMLRIGEENRRKMHNTIQELRGNIRVFARIRPFLPSDNNEYTENKDNNDDDMNIDNDDNNDTIFDFHPDTQTIGLKKKEEEEFKQTHTFSFDKCFPPSTGQEDIFLEVSEFVQSALDGYNVCLFSYGQTGSGKTHTMQGSGIGPMRGIIPRAMEQVGNYQTKLESQGWKYKMEVSFVEIYNESINDLLSSLNKDINNNDDIKYDIKKSSSTGMMYITNVTKIEVDPNNQDKIQKIMSTAARYRSVGITDMNAQSSRSHSIFTLYLTAKNLQKNTSLRGSLSLVDLAGSERLSKSKATGGRLKETQAINKSLSSLTDVFTAIANKQSHIPFRNSKLTYLLQSSLSGNGKSAMIVNLAPTVSSYHESLCSLRFASRVNQCELGKPKRDLSEISTSVNNSSSSTLLKPTSSSKRPSKRLKSSR